jgi:hypothetical protein
MATLIGQVILSSSQVRPAETVRVEVLGDPAAPADKTIAQVFINATLGAVQYLQFPTAGERRLRIVAIAADGSHDERIATVKVVGAPLTFPSFKEREDIAMIGVTQAPGQPYEAVLTLGSFVDARRPPRLNPPGVVGAANSSIAIFKPKRIAAALASTAQDKPRRKALEGYVAHHARTVLQTQTRTFERMRSDACATTRPAKGERASRPRPRPRKLVRETIYDLGQLDLAALAKGLHTEGTPQYEWDFGDGTKTVTRTPTTRHDYFAKIDHAAGTGQFVVTCKALHAGVTVSRTLTIQSAYAMCKRTGKVAPHVTSDVFAHKRHSRLTASFVVYNVEAQPLTLNQVSISPHQNEPAALALPRPFVPLGQPIVVAARGQSVVTLSVPFVAGNPGTGEVHYQATGFTAIYGGQVGDLPVRFSVVFDVPVAEQNLKPQSLPGPQLPELNRKPWPWEIVQSTISQLINPADSVLGKDEVVIDRQTGTLAVALHSLTPPSAAVRAQAAVLAYSMTTAAGKVALDARQLQRQQIQARPPVVDRPTDLTFAPKPLFGGGWGQANEPGAGAFGGAMYALMGPPPAGPVAENEVCEPDNLTGLQLALAEEEQLVCQLTTEEMEVRLPARWGNARKGDILLSPGGSGIIGGLMLNVTPPQWYSHSGIMTRNFDEITHSTGSQKRVMDHLIGISPGSDGFEPSVLKYVWPGAIRQTVEASVHGEEFSDPEYDAKYTISAFGSYTIGVTHNDQMRMIPPLVLKPDPLLETPAVRSALHAIADDAAANAGTPSVKSKYHYRWYCYTDPRIGQGPVEGPAAGWAAGTRPSVCSSYIWMMAKGRGATLETNQAFVFPADLEAPDLAAGAAVRPQTNDGLYKYSAQERLNAGNWLYNEICNQAYDEAGWFGTLLTDGPDDVANQFLNAFENDDADGKDSEDWQQVEDADAVSPDDMLWWDGPERGGLYGFAEPAKYIEPRNETYRVSRWKKVLNRGTVRGRVLHAGQPVAGALVQVYESKNDFSDAAGQYELRDVPLGPYTLTAQKVIDNVLKTAALAIVVDAENETFDISLQDPPERFRRAQVMLDFWGRDDEWGDDEFTDPGAEYFEVALSPDQLTHTTSRTYRWGGELRAEYRITFRLLVNNTIDVQIDGKLYEGTSEDTGDLDGLGSTNLQVPVNQTQAATLSITNTEEDDPDEGRLAISVRNIRSDA